MNSPARAKSKSPLTFKSELIELRSPSAGTSGIISTGITVAVGGGGGFDSFDTAGCGVAVGGIGVAVGGTRVGGIGVAVGGTGVGGTGVGVMPFPAANVGPALPITNNKPRLKTDMVRMIVFIVLSVAFI